MEKHITLSKLWFHWHLIGLINQTDSVKNLQKYALGKKCINWKYANIVEGVEIIDAKH